VVAKVDISILFETAYIRRGQLWRLVTNIFSASRYSSFGIQCLVLWIFGTKVESALGHAKTALLVLFVAVGSGSFDFAFAHGGSDCPALATVFSGCYGSCPRMTPDSKMHSNPHDLTFCRVVFPLHFYDGHGHLSSRKCCPWTGAVFGAIVAYAVSAPRYRLFFITATGLLLPLALLLRLFCGLT